MEPGGRQPTVSPRAPAPAANQAQTLEELAALLRDLRRRHAREQRDSRLTYRELAQRTGWSQAAIAEYFTARTLPPTDRFDALIEVLGAGPAERRALADARDRVEENQRRAKGGRTAGRTPPAPRSGPAPSGEPRPPVPAGPRQLPADSTLFTGRDGELGQLLALADDTGTGSAPGTVVVCAIGGMGGVGKTALAVHAAHRLAEHFPDGQLFLDLHGFAHDRTPRDPGDALAALLHSLGVPPQRVPPDLDSRAALYRDRLAGTRTLIVLDNAADEAQVGPLLPAADTCLVLVTSRRRLAALDDAVPVPLEALPGKEAVAVLRRAARFDSEPADDALWHQAADLCGRLPLALVIAAALLRTGGKAWSLRRLLDRLATRRPGAELAGYTDETRSLTAVFDLSYQALPEAERLLFRRLSLLPGPRIDAYAAAALLDAALEKADRLLQRLADHSLLSSASPGHYGLHDLVRAHARTLADGDRQDEREAAQGRLFDYYQHTAQRAGAMIDRVPRPRPGGTAPRHAPDLPDQESAQAWLRLERADLEAAFDHARGLGPTPYAVGLAAGLALIMNADGPWPRALDVHQAAAATAEQLGDRPGHAGALSDLGRVRRLTGDLTGADDALTRALRLHRDLGDRHGEAGALSELGRIRPLTGDSSGGEDALTEALALYLSLDSRLGQATVLVEVGGVRYVAGDYPGAADALTRALTLYQGLDHRLGQAVALTELGRVRSFTRDLPGAVGALTRALGLFRGFGQRQGQATALTELGRVRQLTGDLAGAADALTQALQLYRGLGHRYGQAFALAELGVVRRLTGDYPGAADAFKDSLHLYRTLGIRGNEAYTLNHYAALLLATGDCPQALGLYRQALAMNRELNKPDDEAHSLEGIGECRLAQGDADQGAKHLHEALEIYRHLAMRSDADRVQSRLDGLATW
jgi:tetratricopeptide (TPR) repeat protein